MKALLNCTMIFDVEDESEAAAVALAMRQRAYIDLTELCESKGYDPSSFEIYEPVFSLQLDLEATL